MSRTRTITTAGAVGLLAITSIAGPTMGASHREAPSIANDPSADITDLYAFVSPDRPDTVTIIANYTGFQEPAGGPNFYPFNPDVLYWIKVDNNGDGVQDLTWAFRFHTDVANPDSFLYSGYGTIPGTDANVTQSYDVELNTVSLGSGLYVPPANIGPRTTPKYQAIAANAVHLLSDEATRVFAGQRDDPFFVDLGAIFDLGGLRPFNGAHAITPPKAAKGQDDLSGFNVNTIAIQVPKSALTVDGTEPTDSTAATSVIGIWAGASRQALSVDTTTPGEWVQVSRLGNPLINEVIIPVGRKDEWNASNPADDAQYQDYYLNPELARIINTVYPTLPDTRIEGRSDLVLILGQGVPSVNATNTGETLYDMLRLNLAIPVAKKEVHSILGALGGDVAGFPNGRRLEDDVVDIELRAVADGYGDFLAGAFTLPNNAPNNTVGDGCNANDAKFLSTFPYVATPWPGYKGGDYRRVCGKKT